MLQLRKSDYVLIIASLALLVFVGLFLFRHLDDNRLTSWNWALRNPRPAFLLGVLAASLAVSWLLSRLPVPGNAVLFVFSFAAAAAFWREPEVLVDASRYFTQAKHLELYGVEYFARQWGGQIGAWTDLPLVPFLYGLVYRVFGETRAFTQSLTTAMFSITVVLTSLTGRDLWDERVGLGGGALLMAMPYLYSQVPLLLVDVPAMFFLMLAVFSFNRALWRGGLPMAALSSAAVFLSVMSKYSAWLMLTVLGVVFLVRLREAPKRTVLRAAAVFLLASVLSGAFVLYKYGVVREQIGLLLSYQKPALKGWSESYVSTFLFQVHPFVTAAAVLSVFAALKNRDPRFAVIVWLLVLMLVFEIKRSRYVIPLFPMLALMASYGLREIRAEEVRKFIISVAVVTSLAVGLFVYLPFLRTMSMVNLETSGAYLDTLPPARLRVFTLPQRSSVNPAVAVPLLDMFTSKQITYAYGPPRPPLGEEAGTSPLRFTWEYENPAYYEPSGPDRGWPLVAVISGGPTDPLPMVLLQEMEGYRLLRVFDTSTGLFRFRTMVRIYEKGK